MNCCDNDLTQQAAQDPGEEASFLDQIQAMLDLSDNWLAGEVAPPGSEPAPAPIDATTLRFCGAVVRKVGIGLLEQVVKAVQEEEAEGEADAALVKAAAAQDAAPPGLIIRHAIGSVMWAGRDSCIFCGCRAALSSEHARTKHADECLGMAALRVAESLGLAAIAARKVTAAMDVRVASGREDLAQGAAPPAPEDAAQVAAQQASAAAGERSALATTPSSGPSPEEEP